MRPLAERQSPPFRIRRASPVEAAAQGSWIAAMDPWRELGYGAQSLSTFLRRQADEKQVWVAAQGRPATVSGVLVLQPGVLLGQFVALLAVRPEVAGMGIGGALMNEAEKRTFADRRWLFVSADASNHSALRFYRKRGFVRVGRLPDLVRAGRDEILLRKPRPL